MTKQPTTSTTTTPPIVVATVEAVEAVRNVVPPARDARLPKEAVNLHNGVIPSPLGRSSDGNDVARLGHAEVSEGLSQEVTPADEQNPSKKRKKKSKRAKTKPEAKNRELRSSSTLGRSSDGNDAARLGHSDVSVQEVTPADEQNPSKKRKKKSKRAKTKPEAKNRELRSSSTLGRSSHGDDVPKRGHSDVSVQEVTPADEQNLSKKRKKKSKRAKTKPEAKNRELRSSSTLGRSSHGDDVPKRGHSEVSEVPVQELVPVKEQTSSVQHHENLTQSESLNSKSSPDKKTKGKDRRRPKIFKKIKKRLKRFGKNTRKKFEKKLSTILVLSLLLFFFPHLSNNTIDSGVPQDLQRQGQVTNVMICPPLESASPVAVTPNQSVSKTANTHMQVNQACYVAQQ